MKPSADLRWATDSVTSGISGNPNKLEPFDFKSEGQQESQPVPRQYLNFQFDAIRQWKDYLEEVTDNLLSSSGASLQRSQNLADLINVSTARTNLGLSSAATFQIASTLTAQGGSVDNVLMTPLKSTDHFNARTSVLTRTILGRTTQLDIRNDLGLGTAATQPVNAFASSVTQINTGSGLTGGGDLSTSRTLSVDSTVVRTTGTQTINDVKTFTSPINGNISGNATSVTNGVYTTSNQSIGGTKTFTSRVFAPAFRSTSDPRLKEDLVDHEEVTDIDLIKLKKWVWANHEQVPEQLRGTADSGVDASVVAKVFPNCVEANEDGFLTVDYGKLAVHLILARGV